MRISLRADEDQPAADEAIRSPLVVQAVEVLLPLYGDQVAFVAVALFAAWYDVRFRRAATTHDRNYVVHCELTHRDRTLTVMAFADAKAVFPPLGSPQFTCPALLSGNVLFRSWIEVFHTDPMVALDD